MNPLLLFVLVSLATALPATPFWNLFMSSPNKDKFYRNPGNLGNYKNGDIFRSRKVTPVLDLSTAFSEVTQIAYKTKDTFDNDSYTVATVFKPNNPSPEPKLFSYQFWEDSTDLSCSPSYTLVKGLLSSNWVTEAFDTNVAIQFALLNGYYVVAADHEGPNSAFIEGYTQGHAGLDGIRAAINFFGLDKNTPTALYGYSGGASATIWMSNLHESYAPELNIVGAAHGGTPLDITSIVNWLDRTDRQFSGFIVGAFAGLLSAYPDQKAAIWPHLNKNFQKKLNKMKSNNQCILTEIFQFGHQQFHTQMDVDFWTFPAISEIIKRESLLKEGSTAIISVPKFPRYIFHAKGDQVIPFSAAEQYVQEQCSAGANIQWVPWNGNDHLSVEYLGLPDALQFIKQAFDGQTPALTCGTSSNDPLTLASTNVGGILGQGVADMMEAINGLTSPLGGIDFDSDLGIGN